MSDKSILFMARTTRFHEFARTLTGALDADIYAATPDSPNITREFDLLMLDADGIKSETLDQLARSLENRGGIPMLLIVDEDDIGQVRMPISAPFDFICSGASPAELEVRARRLMGEEEPGNVCDVLRIDGLTINLATYQVCQDGCPVDLTLMEYSLLAFLATHPNRAFSREVLLHRVWGFEYCGGTRTVDVHIRRIRSKLGPQIAAHITTVRGVGYLFKE